MTSDPLIFAAARKGLCLQRRQPGPGAATRWMGAILSIALFGVDAFQPLIGLVEVRQGTDKASVNPQAATDAETAPVTVVSIHAWQWHQPSAEFWPAFVFQPTISAGSANASGSAGPGGVLAAASLPPMPPTSLQVTLPALRWVVQLPGHVPVLRLTACRAICPIGPPLA